MAVLYGLLKIVFSETRDWKGADLMLFGHFSDEPIPTNNGTIIGMSPPSSKLKKL